MQSSHLPIKDKQSGFGYTYIVGTGLTNSTYRLYGT
jgi:hypothetical protein